MRPGVRGGLGACALLLVASSVLASPGSPSVRSPLPFDHEAHQPALAKAELGCAVCHPVGLRREGAEDGEVALPAAPRSTCHGCHGSEIRRAARGAPTECALCHDDRAALRPVDHDLDWTFRHGAASRAAGQSCGNCHTNNACLDCHDRRGAGTVDPHGPGFRRFHGVEARLDPRSCATCHTEASCTACHTSGGSPW